jgi:glutathione S-transferase
MKLTLYAHPFSSYCQKVLIALYENDTPFLMRVLGSEDPAAFSEMTALWPLQKMPVLLDAGRPVLESSIIIEHLSLNHPGPVTLLPSDAQRALEVRFMDRFFDNYVMTPMQKSVGDFIRKEGDRDPHGVAEAKALLTAAYRWLEGVMQNRTWAVADSFSLADCAAAPALLYADWIHAIAEEFPKVRAYRARLLLRPSVARAVDEARPYRKLFPPGAPNRD